MVETRPLRSFFSEDNYVHSRTFTGVWASARRLAAFARCLHIPFDLIKSYAMAPAPLPRCAHLLHFAGDHAGQGPRRAQAVAHGVVRLATKRLWRW